MDYSGGAPGANHIGVDCGGVGDVATGPQHVAAAGLWVDVGYGGPVVAVFHFRVDGEDFPSIVDCHGGVGGVGERRRIHVGEPPVFGVWPGVAGVFGDWHAGDPGCDGGVPVVVGEGMVDRAVFVADSVGVWGGDGSVIAFW